MPPASPPQSRGERDRAIRTLLSVALAGTAALAGLIPATASAVAQTQTTIPVRVTPRPTYTAHINETPVSCLMDTGSPVTMLSDELGAAVGLVGPGLYRMQLEGGLGGGQVIAEAIPARVRVGDLAWDDALVMVVGEGQLLFDCVVGTDLLGRQPVVFDWAAQQVRRP
jgi:hypothetical protein